MGLIGREMLAVLWGFVERVPVLGALLRCLGRRALAAEHKMEALARRMSGIGAPRAKTPLEIWGETPESTPSTSARRLEPPGSGGDGGGSGGGRSSAKVLPAVAADVVATAKETAKRRASWQVGATLEPAKRRASWQMGATQLPSSLGGSDMQGEHAGDAGIGGEETRAAFASLAHSMSVLGRQMQTLQAQLVMMEKRHEEACAAREARDAALGERLRLIERAQTRHSTANKALLSKVDNTLHISALVLKRGGSGGGRRSRGVAEPASSRALEMAGALPLGEDGNECGAMGGVFGADVGFGLGGKLNEDHDDRDDEGITDL